MPAVLETPVAAKASDDEMWTPEGDPVAEAPPGPEEEAPIEEVAVESPVAPVPVPATPPVVETPKHTSQAIQQAARLGISAAEVDEMSPKELERAIAIANRTGQAAYDMGKAASGEVKPQSPKPETDELELDFGLDEEGKPIEAKDIHPGILNAIKGMAKKIEQKVQSKFQTVEQERQQAAVKAVHDRVSAGIAGLGAEVAKSFDRTSGSGAANFNELLSVMDGIYQGGKRAGKNYTEPEIIERAVRALGISVTPAKEEDSALKAKAKEWDEGSLGKPKKRVEGSGFDESLDRVRREVRAKEQIETPADAVEWLP